MTIHNFRMTAAARALFALGNRIHTKEADAFELLQKAFDDNSAAVLKKLGLTEQQVKALDDRLNGVEQKMAVRGRLGGIPVPETWGRQVIDAQEMKSLDGNFKGRVRINVKASTITSTTADVAGAAGDLVASDRQPGFIPLPRRQLTVRQLFSPGQTASNSIEWPKMTGRTNNAASQDGEGSLKAQSDYKFDLVAWPVRTIAHFVVASKQILDDAPALMSIIDSELRYGLADVEDGQLLNGDGSGSTLVGAYTNAAAFSAPFVIASPTMIDVLLQAIAQLDLAKYQPDGIVLNPLDWRKIQSIKDGDGRYLGGGPFGDLIARLWQMPIATTTSIPTGKFMVGANREGAQIFDRQDATVEISTEDGDNFRRNLVTIRAEERLAFVVKYADAFVKGSFPT